MQAALLLLPLVLASSPYRVATLAGGAGGAGVTGPAIGAVLTEVQGLAADARGNLYVAETGAHRVRQISPGGILRTVAGTGEPGFSGDGGPALEARLNAPYGLACDAAGNLYIADLGNGRVRRVALDGTITTVAEGFAAPRNIAIDHTTVLYVSDFGAHRVYRVDLQSGTRTVVAGTGESGESGDRGPAALARLSNPAGLAVGQDGAIYIADSGNGAVRKVSSGGITTLYRGGIPTGLAFGADGALYVADASSGYVLRLPVSGERSIVSFAARDVTAQAGAVYATDGSVVLRVSDGSFAVKAGGGSGAPGDGGPATEARLRRPSGVAVDHAGTAYIADRDDHRVRQVTADGIISTVPGTDDPRGVPSAVSVDASGTLYVTDTALRRVLVLKPDGAASQIPLIDLDDPVAAIPDGAGNVYIADAAQGTIVRVGPNGAAVPVVTGLVSPQGLALDPLGNLYFADAGANRIGKRLPGGVIQDLASGAWNIPRGVAVDADGNVFVADTGSHRVQRVDPSGRVTVLAGDGTPGFSGDGGLGRAARLNFPWNLAVTPDGRIAIADLENSRVRLLTPDPDLTTLSAVRNAASLEAGPIAPGMLLILEGTALEGPDTEVWFDEARAQVLSGDDVRLILVAPAEIAGRQRVDVRVAHAALPVEVAGAVPTLFTDGSGHALATGEDGSLVTPDQPAARGSVAVLYGTGLGISGAPVSAYIGGLGAEVLYVGPISGYPGLFQCNLRVPTALAESGDLPVVLLVGGAVSPFGVTLPVR